VCPLVPARQHTGAPPDVTCCLHHVDIQSVYVTSGISGAMWRSPLPGAFAH